MNQNPQLVLSLTASDRLPETFTLLDVGASGGIALPWYAFGKKLVAYGFDRLIAEVERLNGRIPENRRVEYIAANIVRTASEPPIVPPGDTTYVRSSTCRSQQLLGDDWMTRYNNAGNEVVYADVSFSIDEFVEARRLGTVDFIKVDVDGTDFEVLLGAKTTLTQRGVLGVCVEVIFNAPPHPATNLFTNHDAFLRSLGFRLYDLELRRYTRAALPGRFMLNMPSPTIEGQICQGDALYLRDFADPSITEAFGRPTPGQLLKLAGIFEIFGFNDCAIELLQAFERDIPKELDIEQLCSMLAEEAYGVRDYPAYIRDFEQCMRTYRFGPFSAAAEAQS